MPPYIEIHTPIREKLKYFHSVKKIPNIIFHGPCGSGKRTIVNEFINLIYNKNKDLIKNFVMHVNCAYGKGIKFIRDELKFFAKTNIQCNGGDTFKSVILFNADNLTTDAQSALRRCIELYNHTTRFFIIVEDKYKILKPILSRFCEIHVYRPVLNDVHTNMYCYNVQETFRLKPYMNQRTEWLKKELAKPNNDAGSVIALSTKLYEKGYSALDILYLLESDPNYFPHLSNLKLNELILGFNKIKRDIKHEKTMMLCMLNFLYLDTMTSLENVSFI